MKLNLLEKNIIKNFLEKNKSGVQYDEFFYSELIVLNREFSGVGFMTCLHRYDELKVSSRDLSFKWGNVGAILNSEIDTGYLLYINDGYLAVIEGYTYDDDWPKEINSLDLYEV